MVFLTKYSLFNWLNLKFTQAVTVMMPLNDTIQLTLNASAYKTPSGHQQERVKLYHLNISVPWPEQTTILEVV
jgi:hypothetical protein